MKIVEMATDERKLECTGVGRDDSHAALDFYFNRLVTDDEMRFLHEVIKRAVAGAALEAAEAAAWRPIAEADKNCPAIVCGGTLLDESSIYPDWEPFYGTSIAHWDTVRGEWCGHQTDNQDEFYLHRPMYFMPLPTPVKE